MPIYFFDTRTQGRTIEDEGFEFSGIEAAKSEAAKYLIDVAKNHLKPNQPSQELICTVRDVTKRALVRVRLVLEISPPL